MAAADATAAASNNIDRLALNFPALQMIEKALTMQWPRSTRPLRAMPYKALEGLTSPLRTFEGLAGLDDKAFFCLPIECVQQQQQQQWQKQYKQ